ncbi:MAG: putative DNA modification/repair radical SAM protein [Candidatus Lokiarchaeota archaeon]|nr:putative DNA modification/repair radical SAM protein [Candidatus Lokiarchaeota archaeon]
MNSVQKLEVLGAAAKYDICQSTASSRITKKVNRIGNVIPSGLCHSVLPDGRTLCMLKVLYSNKCAHDCAYCVNSTCINRNVRKIKTSFEPKELAKLFVNYYIRNYVEGLFLSSGVCSGQEQTMEDMIEAVSILRNNYNFEGYIHLKILPGTPYSLVKQAALIADRISVNLEAPNNSRFNELSSTKDYKSDLLTRLAWIKGLKNKRIYNREKNKYIPAGFTTQYVVGAANETDFEILKMSNWCYEKFNLNRSYYSAFSPIKGSPLEDQEPTKLKREHRLYQCDWLLRIYKYDFSELFFGENKCIPLDKDPKIYSALKFHSELFPLEINEADYETLLKVPGIGPVSARRIVNLNKKGKKISKFIELKNIGVVIKRARPFVSLNGKKQSTLDDYFSGKYILNINH